MECSVMNKFAEKIGKFVLLKMQKINSTTQEEIPKNLIETNQKGQRR